MASTPLVIAAISPLELLLRGLGPLVLAAAAAWALDRMCLQRGLMPPGFHRPWRRAAGFALVTAVLWVAVFSPLGTVGVPHKVDLARISTPQLFLLHVLMVAALLGWFALGFAGAGRPPAAPSADLPAPAAAGGPERASAEQAVGEQTGAAQAIAELAGAGQTGPEPAGAGQRLPPPPSFGRQVAAQLGLVAPAIRWEVLIGGVLGLAAWGAVLLAVLAVAVAVWAMAGERALPKPSEIVPWIATLPIGVRLLVSLSAGFVEEIFFRGFLQPRAGIALSTACFVLAHVSYGQPIMLVGITLLSLIYAFLVRWRQTVWPAIAAHSLFDGIQLLVIIPLAMRLLGRAATSRAALAAASHLAGALARGGAGWAPLQIW